MARTAVASAGELGQHMAGLTRIICDLIAGALEDEREQGWLHNWRAAFHDTLIPDLDVKQFADMFAQTLAYGLFAARVHAPPREPFSRKVAAFNLPKTNPFVTKLFAEIAGVDMPDSITWAVDDLVETLKHADMAEILADFSKSEGKGDPVVHFYETFLAAYNPKMREVRGVYYTPEPVVRYMVRSIDHLLRARFDRPRGLADENTLVLDPACGTGTFLYLVIDEIRRGFAKQAAAWVDYVSKHLLSRVFGFELLMAPYAIAHLKLGMQLQQSGYRFGPDQRLGIYLTNTLEEAAEKTEHLFADWVADEANAAAEIKHEKPIMVVLGNPPYSGISANRGEWIARLLEDYRCVDGRPLGEKKVWLADDYVKFLRFAQWRVAQTGQGIVAMITNHAFVDNPTFRGMRQSLLRDFDEIYVLDLHGSIKKQRCLPGGGKDENVFDIQQGVAITMFVRHPEHRVPGTVFHADLWGTRAEKYERLLESDVATVSWKEFSPSTPYYFFVPRSEKHRAEYERCWKITEAMPLCVAGFITARDHFVVDFSRDELLSRIADFADPGTSDDQIRTGYFAGRGSDKYADGDTRGWKVSDARKRVQSDKDWESRVKTCHYRPFDNRFVYWADWMVDWPRPEMSGHMLAGENVAMVVCRQSVGGQWAHVLATKGITESCYVSNKTREIGYVAPLYLYPNGGRFPDRFSHRNGRDCNLSAGFADALAARLGIQFVAEGPGNLHDTVGPEDVLNYAYAVFHSPTYRARYAEFLKIDFPRLPLTADVQLFRTLAAQGAELVALHLLESPKLQQSQTEWPVQGDHVVDKVQYIEKEHRVWINKRQYFGGVPQSVWEFRVGGYQVCYKWLKDRKGRKLTCQDAQHYQKIVVALNETIRLMAEIDDTIARCCGWPLQ